MVAINCMSDSKYVNAFEDFVKTDDALWLVQPFYNGGNLADLIAKHPNGLEPEYVRKIMKQIVDGDGLLLKKDFFLFLNPNDIMLHCHQNHQNSGNDETLPQEQMNNFKTSFKNNIDSIEVKFIDFSNVLLMKKR